MTKEEYRELEILLSGLQVVGLTKRTEERLEKSLQVIHRDKQLLISGVGSSLPDLAECNQASLDYAAKKDNPDFFLIKQTFKEGINWALNYVTKNK